MASRDAPWRRIAGFRVVMSWPQAGYAPPPRKLLLVIAGAVTIGVAIAAQVYAPQPSPTAAGILGPYGGQAHAPLSRSLPVSVDIPAIGVHSQLLHLGDNPDGTIRVPSLNTRADEAAWYKYSATPGQMGVSVIEGHVDNYQGAAVFFRLGALRPGDSIEVTLANGTTAVFRVTGVRQYVKTRYPAATIYGATGFPALRLITCGGTFDYTTRSYLSSTVVFASLTSARRPAGA